MDAMIEVLPVTPGKVLRVWWAYFWRSVLTLGVMLFAIALSGIVFGLMLSLALTALGMDMQAAQGWSQAVGTVLGFFAGLLSSFIPVWLILGKDFGGFHLALITYQPATGE